MKTIDFHTHIVPGQYPARPASIDEPAWPVMEKVDDQHSRMMIAGKQFRVFESFYWNPQERVRRLDEEGIDVQVISPLPELLSYWLKADAGVAITDFMNQFVADMVRTVPSRFVGMGAVALQDPRRSGQQLEGFRALGLKGVHVGSHVNGKSIADPEFYPFLEAAAALDLAVFVHGIKPGTPERMLGSPMMPAVVAVPHENTMAISSFIMTDILKRFPKLRLVFAHGGGSIGSVIDRFTATWKAFGAMRTTLSAPSPSEYARLFWYDTVVFGADYLRLLVSKFGADRFIGGTDGPVSFGQPSVPQLVQGAGLSSTDAELIAHRNAERVLGL
jgi:aminocarboxymuconate-semialdehyde decarboxylase